MRKLKERIKKYLIEKICITRHLKLDKKIKLLKKLSNY